MDRRKLLQAGTGLLAVSCFGGRALAQAATGSPAFALSAYSRNLQWLRTPQELAKGVIDLGLSRVDLTVSAANGHVDPARAATDLPAFVRALGAAGVEVTCITTDIVDADSANAEAVLKAAAAAGVGHFVWGGLTYEDDAPYLAQLDGLRPRVARLARLGERYRIKGLYQPARGANAVGATFFDILQLVRAHDPRWMGIHYDCAALLQATPETMVSQLRSGREYIGGVAITDARVELKLPEWKEGSYAGDPMFLLGAYSGGDFAGADGAEVPADPLALGGGGRPLPYRFEGVRVGTGMLDLSLLGRTLREIGFSGPAETQLMYELAGAEAGATSITAERLNVLGQIKRDRIIVEHAFAEPWGLKVALPPFMLRRQAAAAAAAQE